MKLTLVILALVGCVAAASIPSGVKTADKEFLQKQKFLFEIVYRVQEPLMFEDYIKLGSKLISDQSHYNKFDFYMEKFYHGYKSGALLPKGEFFGQLVKAHYKQARGLFNFFYYAKDFQTFMSNVCWARMHVNEGMFVYALTLAVIHRDDCTGLILPSIYEIFPQSFFHSKFIRQAEKFDYDSWSKMVMYEKEFNDAYYKNNKIVRDLPYQYTKDYKLWQWWKLMGLDDKFYLEEKYPQRENINEYNKDPKWLEALKGTKFFYKPVDYTRDIEIFNENSKMSYFTEDLGWNAYWYYLNMDYAFFLNGEEFGLNKDRRGEYWIYTVQQLLARYYMERLSNGLGLIPDFSFDHEIQYGYDPQLTYYNGVGYSYRKNYYEIGSTANFNMLTKVRSYISRIDNMIAQGYYRTADGKMIDLRKPESIEYIGNLLQGNVDVYDSQFYSYWTLLTHMFLGDINSYSQMEVFPNVFLNYETMLRDPVFYMVYKKITEAFYYFKFNIKPYTTEELMLPGVKIDNVQVDQLQTYYDLVDFDVSNLLTDKVTFADGQFVWDKTLLARQQRLNHKPFNFEFTIESDKPQRVVIRTFLGPKYDEFGRVIPLSENRRNFMEIDQFAYNLVAGKNDIKRSSEEFFYSYGDRTTYTELYKFVMLAHEGKYEFPLDISEPHCAFPDRLILPRGWSSGMPMQLFVIVSPYTGTQEQYSNFDSTYSCGIGSGSRYVDNKPFGYPLDRSIVEHEFFVPNMYFKDVKIYHDGKYSKYIEGKYQSYGQFDYAY